MSVQSSILVLLVSITPCINGIFSIWGKNTGKSEPQAPPFCSKPPFFGGCQPIVKEWYSNATENSCRPISAGLCSGGGNRFVTAAKCKEMCERQKLFSSKKKLPQMCLTIPVFVSCGQVAHAWYYDAYTKSCKVFTYNALTCRMEGNMFLSEMKCQAICMPRTKSKAVCSLSPLPDRCVLQNKRWFFNFTTNECLRFPGSGCGKGSNSFSTVEKCMITCSYNNIAVFISQGDKTNQTQLPGNPTQPFPIYRSHPPGGQAPATPPVLPTQPAFPPQPSQIGTPGLPTVPMPSSRPAVPVLRGRNSNSNFPGHPNQINPAFPSPSNAGFGQTKAATFGPPGVPPLSGGPGHSIPNNLQVPPGSPGVFGSPGKLIVPQQNSGPNMGLSPPPANLNGALRTPGGPTGPQGIPNSPGLPSSPRFATEGQPAMPIVQGAPFYSAGPGGPLQAPLPRQRPK